MAKQSKRKAALAAAEAARLPKAAEHAAKATEVAAQAATHDALENPTGVVPQAIIEANKQPKVSNPNTEKFTGIQRAATVITAMGAENAARVYKFLSEEDVEKLTFEVSRMAYMDIGTVDDILTGYYELCLTQKVITEGGIGYAQQVLE